MRLFRSSNCCFSVWPGLLGDGWASSASGVAAPGPGGQLLGQVVGQLHELLVGGHRGAFATQVDHRADVARRER